MGYTTDFDGHLKLSRPTTEKEKTYLDKFSDTRRMGRDVEKLFELFNGKHGKPNTKIREEIYGVDGEYFVGGGGSMGQGRDESIINFNSPSPNQPGLWCQWVLNDDGTELEWNGGEKFYSYTEWLEYLIKHFFEPWGIKLNGEIQWQGEDRSDIGMIVVIDNDVTVKEGKITYQ